MTTNLTLFLPLRFLTGLALLLQQQQNTSERVEKEAALLLHQGLELFISQRCSQGSVNVCVGVSGASGDAIESTVKSCKKGGGTVETAAGDPASLILKPGLSFLTTFSSLEKFNVHIHNV